MSEPGLLAFECPHCAHKFVMLESEIACGIVRHGAINDTPIPPHASKEECEKYLRMPNVRGCCRPVKIVKKDNDYVAEICDYI